MKRNRSWSFLLVLMMVLSSFLATSNFSLAATMEGEGTEVSPYLIKTADDLYRIPDNPEAHFKLMNDLDLGNIKRKPMAEFNGVFDGNGFSISNVYLANEESNWVGLFTKVGKGTIKNISIKNVQINASPFYSGVLCGESTSKSTFSNCYTSNVSISGEGQCVGGITGIDRGGSFYQCYADVNIDVFGTALGGIIGQGDNLPRLNQCYTIGEIKGSRAIAGLVGYKSARIENSYSKCKITATNEYKAGGLVGDPAPSTNPESSTIINSYYAGKIISDIKLGLAFGTITDSYFDQDLSEILTPPEQARTTAQMFKKSNYEGWDFETVWYIDEGKDYPSLRFLKEPEQSINALDMVLEVDEMLLLSIDRHLSENMNVVWKSSNESAAIVESDGVVRAIAIGETTITATAKNGKFVEKINILVVESSVDYRLAADLKVGLSCRATVDKNQNTAKVTWYAMDESVATVSSKGKITAQGEGLTLVTATNEEGKVVGEVYVRVR